MIWSRFKNSKEERLTNGDIVKIKSIKGDEMTFEDGRKIDKTLKAHGLWL